MHPNSPLARSSNHQPNKATMGKAMIDNPFRVPQELESNLLKLRKEEKERRRTEKLNERRSTKLARQSSQSIRNDSSNDVPSSTAQTPLHSTPKKETSHLDVMYKENDILARNTPDGKMSIKEFVSKKREMLLLNMKIDTQYENIANLHRQLKEREDTLKAKEASLTESMQRFDAFLKETDEKAQAAQRQAERETAKRIKKQQEVNALNDQLKAVQSQISKHNDTLEEFERCKTFIESLTPPSWFDECADAKRKRQQQRRRDRIKARQEKYRIEQQKLSDEKTKSGDGKRCAVPRSRSRKMENTELEEITVPDFEDEPLTSSDEECPMYFQDPDQLHERMNELENENRSLLKQINDCEDSLRDIKDKIKRVESNDGVDA